MKIFVFNNQINLHAKKKSSTLIGTVSIFIFANDHFKNLIRFL
jgi:hypothetical protein